jgi:hypothetical protein
LELFAQVVAIDRAREEEALDETERQKQQRQGVKKQEAGDPMTV